MTDLLRDEDIWGQSTSSNDGALSDADIWGAPVTPAAPRSRKDQGRVGVPDPTDADIPSQVAQSKVINGREYRLGKNSGEVFDDKNQVVEDPAILQQFGKTVAPGVTDYASELGKSAVRAVGSAASSTASGFGVMTTDTQSTISQVEQGIKDFPRMSPPDQQAFYDSLGERLSPVVAFNYRVALRKMLKGDTEGANSYIETARKYTDTTPVDEQSLTKAGKKLEKSTETAFPQDPRFRGSFTSDVGGAFGGAAFYLPIGLLTGGTGVAVSGAAGGADQSYRQAKEAIAGNVFDANGNRIQNRDDRGGFYNAGLGAEAEQKALEAGRLGALPGASEVVPTEVFLEQMPKFIPGLRTIANTPTWGRFAKAFGRIGTQVLSEGGQEAFQQWASNVIQKLKIDPSQDVTEDVLYNALLGGIVGGGMQAGVETYNAVTGKTDQPAPGTPPAAPQPTPPAQRIEPQLFPQQPQQQAPQPQPQTAGQGAPGTATQPQPTPTNPVVTGAPAEAYLLGAGYTPEQIADMNPDERDAALQEAIDAGIEPVDLTAGAPAPGTAPMAPRATPQAPQAAAPAQPAPPAPGTAPMAPRASQAAPAAPAPQPLAPGPAIWANADSDLPVNVVDEPPQLHPETGQYFQKIEDGNGQTGYVPLDELQPAPPAPPETAMPEAPQPADQNAPDSGMGLIGQEPGPESAAPSAEISAPPAAANTPAVSAPQPPIAENSAPAPDDFDAAFSAALDQEFGPAQVAPEATPAPAPEPVNVEKALDAFLAGKKPLTAEAFAKAAKIDPSEAGRALQQAALKGRIMQGRNGQWRRNRTVSQPLDLMAFIASEGGIQDPTGELAGMDLPKMTQFGPVVRKNGLHPDRMRERLIEEGYLDDPSWGTDQPPMTSVADVYDLIGRHMSGKKVYSAFDQAEADALETARKNENAPDDYVDRHPIEQRWGAEVWQKIQKYFNEYGSYEEAWSPQEVNDAARMVAEGMNAEDAFERAAIIHVDDLLEFADIAPEITAAFERTRLTGMLEPPPFPDVEQPADDVQQQGSPEDRQGVSAPGAASDQAGSEAEAGNPSPQVRDAGESGTEAGSAGQTAVEEWLIQPNENGVFDDADAIETIKKREGSSFYEIRVFEPQPNKFIGSYSYEIAGYSGGATIATAEDVQAGKFTSPNPEYKVSGRDAARMEQVDWLATKFEEAFRDKNVSAGAKRDIKKLLLSLKTITDELGIPFDPAPEGERQPSALDEPTTEQGADNKPQLVIPGAEQDQAGALNNAVKAPLKAKAPQKGMDIGLFGSERDQTDIFDQPAPPAKTAAKSLQEQGAEAFAEGKPRRAPLELGAKTAVEYNRAAQKWLEGWDRANLAATKSENTPETSTAAEIKDTQTRIADIKDKLVIFSSGMSRLKDFLSGAYTTGSLSTRGIGIDINETSAANLAEMADKIVQWQTRAFIDSGAFGVFKWNLKERVKYENALIDLFARENAEAPELKQLSDTELLKKYDAVQLALSEASERAGEEGYPQPLFVAPDIVGDQQGSIALVRKNATWLKRHLNAGREVIIPVQKGKLTLTEAYREVEKILGRNDFIVGVPSNQKAVSDQEFADFVAEVKPPKIHFLGTTDEKKLEPRLTAIAEAGYVPDHISSDANMLRALLYGRSDVAETRDEGIRRVLKDRSPEFQQLAGEGKPAASDFDTALDNALDQEFGAEEKPKPKRGLQGDWWESLMGGGEGSGKPKRQPKTAGQTAASPTMPPGIELVSVRQLTAAEVKNTVWKAGQFNAIVKRETPYAVYDATADTRDEAIAKAIALATPKTAGQAASSAVKNTGMAAGDIVKGLEALFGGKNKLSSGFTFDEESYKASLPYFRAAVAHLKEAAKDVNELALALVKFFKQNGLSRDALENMRPYLRRFADEVREGKIALGEEPAPAAEAPKAAVHPIVQAFADYLSSPDNSFETITEARKFAAERGFKAEPGTPAAKELDEMLEQAVVMTARGIVAASKSRPVTTAYRRLVDLYQRQPNLGVRTSESMADQAYSTPAPLAYIASRLAGVASAKSVLEPTAGNGMLLIEATPSKADVNEINDRRAAALEAQGFRVSQLDAATDNLRHVGYPVDSVIANPPFGAVKQSNGSSKEFEVDGWTTTQIDHAIALRALKNLKDGGRAVLIVGSVKEGTDKTRSDSYNTKQKREFYWRLYQGYNVTDHFTVAGDLYKRQGAGWPVDVIVIEGKGKSARPLPAAELPKFYDTWESLEEKLNEAPVKSQPAASEDVGGGPLPQPSDVGRVAKDGQQLEAGSRRDQSPDGAGRPAAVEPAADGQGGVSERGDQRELDGAREQQPAKPDGGEVASGERGQRGGDREPPVHGRERLKQDAEAAQQPYRPMSSQPSLDTKIPTNMADAVETSLRDLSDRYGAIDAWIENELGYKKGEIGKYLAAEQVDAVALALDNVKKNAAFIIGDQTGIGKGRVVASALRYAMRQGLVPIFVTEKPNLYGDIIRDLTDIGVPQMLGRDLKPFLTNAGESIPLDDDAVAWYDEAQRAKAEGQPAPPKRGKFLRASGGDLHKRQMAALQKDGTGKDFDIIFTTYDQMNTVKGQTTDRRRLIDGLADRAFIVLDESHNAGGTEASERGPKNGPESRSDFLKKATGKAKAVMFSSATYAKRPGVMALYARTDMGKAVEKPEMLGELIGRGGVPMQQVVASMLAKAGQYIRRERSFDGVSYDVEPVNVDAKAYEAVSTALSAIARFDIELKKSKVWDEVKENLKKEAEALAMDSGTGGASVNSTNFTSLMHNIVNQMLLAIKTDAVATRAIDALKAGEKPVITVANTMGAFLKSYAEDNDVKLGDAVDLSFRDVLSRYLERTRRLTAKRPDNTTYHVTIPLSALPGFMQKGYADAEKLIASIDTTNLPISPIDWLRFRLAQAGYRVSEITGRKEILEYAGPDNATFAQRLDSEVSPAGRRVNIDKFNRGDIDVMILNRAGSTGLSLHASSKFKDQRRRRMIIAQAELNIDVHMQMLGRVHRTGQVIPPAFVQAYADVPGEARPAAVLAKKMASLNANTTASRKSAFSADDSVDFLNAYGDQVAREFLAENPDLGALLDVSVADDSETARELTGRLLLLPVAEQKRALDDITARYKVLIENLDAMGENALEAKTMDLEAKTVGRSELKAAEGDSPFTQAVTLEEVEVKAQGKALPMSEIIEKAAEGLGMGKVSAENPESALNELERMAQRARPGFTRKWLEDFDRMSADELKVTKNLDLRAKREEAHAQNRQRFVQLTDLLMPGQRVTVRAKDGAPLTGIVLNTFRRGQTGVTGNPLALGAWTSEIAIPDNAQRITVPFSSMALSGDAVGEGVKKVFVEMPDWATGIKQTIEAFDNARKTGKETRYIVTGNILAGFDQTKGQGQIVNYTDDQGNVKPGILMAKSFNPKTFLNQRAVRFKTAAQVIEFLKRLPAAEISSHDDIITVRKADAFTEIEMPAARQTGGTYFLNPDVRKAAYDQFTKVGTRMRYRTNLPDALARVLDAMMNAGAVFQTTDQQDVAEEIVTGKKPGAKPEGFRSGNDFTSPGDSFAFVSREDFSPGGKQLGEAARDYVVVNGRRTGNEYLLALDDEGRIVAEGHGSDSNSVGISLDFMKALKNPSEAIVVHHNHPESTTLSIQDIQMLQLPGLSAVWAHGHNGSSARAAATPEMRRAMEDMSPFQREHNWHLILRRVWNFTSDYLRMQVLQGRISQTESNRVTPHIQNMILARAGVIEYKTVGHDFPEMTTLPLVAGRIDLWARSVRAEIESSLNAKLKPGVDDVRYTPDLRGHIADVGTPPREGAQLAGQRREQAVRNQPGGGNNRLEKENGNVGFEGRGRLRPPRNAAPGSFEAPHDERVRRALLDSTDTILNRIRRAGSAFGIEFRRKTQDREVDLLRTQTAIEQASGRIAEPQNAYLAASLYPGRVAQRDKDLVKDVVEPLVKEIADRGLTLDEVDEFNMARHAFERNIEVGQLHRPGTQFHEAMTNPAIVGASGLSENEASNILNRAVASGKFRDLEAVGNKIVALNRNTLTSLYNEGLITQEQYDALTAKYQYYVPLRGWDDVTDDAHPDSPRSGRRYDIRGPEFQSALGRTSKADSPLAYSIMQARQAIIRIEKNRVGKRFLRLAQANPNPAFWEVNRREMKRVIDPNTGFVRNVYDRGAQQAENVYAVKVGGKTWHVTLHHEGLLKAMKGIGAENMHDAAVFFHKINRFLAAMNTSYDPEFIFRNFLRDVQQAGIVLQEEQVRGLTRRVIASIPQAALGMNRMLQGDLSTPWARYAREFADAGGKIGFMDRGTIETEKRNLERLMGEANAGLTGKLWLAAKEESLGRIERWNDTVENTLRLATYVQLRQAGATRDKAAFAARELTVNFNRKGELGPFINAGWMFFNASMQGTANLAMRLARSKRMRQIAMGIVVEAFLVDMLNRMIAGDDDDDKNRWDKIPADIKAKNHIFMMPKWIEDKYGLPFIKIPLPLGYNFFHVIGTQTGGAVAGAVSPMEAASNMIGAFADAFNPLGTGGTPLNFFLPTLLDPLGDIVTNKDYMGQDIMPRQFDETTPFAERYNPNVAPWARWITDTLSSFTGGSPERPGAIDWSPEWVEYMFDFAGGGVSRLISRTMTTAENLTSGEELDVGKIPFARVFAGRDSRFEDRDEYFRIRDAVHITEKEIKARIAEGNREEAARIRQKYAREVQMIPVMDAAEKRLAKLRKDYKAVKNAQKMGEATRKKRLEFLSEQMDELQLKVRTRWNRLGDTDRQPVQ